MDNLKIIMPDGTIELEKKESDAIREIAKQRGLSLSETLEMILREQLLKEEAKLYMEKHKHDKMFKHPQRVIK